MTGLGPWIRRLLHAARVGLHWRVRKSLVLPYLPYGVSIEVTNRCNFKCSFCPQSLSNHFEEVAATTLSPERADDLLSRIRDSGLDTRIIHWTLDGEPFMNKDFGAIVGRAAAHGFNTHHFSSNGLLMTPERLLEFPRVGQRYFIAPDFCSDPELFEKHRGTRGSWELVRANLVGILEHPDLEHVHLVVHDITAYSVQDQDERNRRFKDLRALFPQSDRLEVRSRIFHNAAGLASEEGSGSDDASEDRRYHLCPYPWYSMSIASNGNVVACCRDLEHQTVLGNLFENSLEEIWNGRAYRQLRQDLVDKAPERQAACSGCDMPWDRSKFSAGNLAATARNRLLLFRS